MYVALELFVTSRERWLHAGTIHEQQSHLRRVYGFSLETQGVSSVGNLFIETNNVYKKQKLIFCCH